MKLSVALIVELILLLVIPVSLVLVLVPWRSKATTIPAGPVQSRTARAKESAATDEKVLIQAAEIAELFGWQRKASPMPAVVPKQEAPVEANWFTNMGFVVGPDGKKTYLFKDGKSGQVVSLAQGESVRGWKLVEITEASFLLEFQGKEYIIRR